VILSPEDLVSCDTTDLGCNGGWLNNAWEFLETTGVTSDACVPYTSGGGSVPQCPKSCSNSLPLKTYKCISKSTVECTDKTSIQAEIYNNGPMETAFSVYDDFFNYESGVYYHTSGGYAGGHAVKMLGWGNEDGMDYWLCANSWGASWGEQGFFKIKMGDCGIDQTLYACQPQL